MAQVGWGWTFFLLYMIYVNFPTFIAVPSLIGIFLFFWFWCNTGMGVRQKMQIAQWNDPTEGSIFMKLKVDTTNVQKYLSDLEKKTGQKVTVTHFVGKAIGIAISQSKKLNGTIVLGRFVPKKTVDICFLVGVRNEEMHKNDLGFTKVVDVVNKPLSEISQQMRANSEKILKNKDLDKIKIENLTKMLPTFILKPLAVTTAFLSNCCGIDVKPLGLNAYAFGGAVITSVGMLGIEDAFAPFTPFFHVPCVILVGSIKDKVVVIDGKMEIRPMLNINATGDHRYIDGLEAGTLSKVVAHLFEHPEDMELEPKVFSEEKVKLLNRISKS